MRSTMSADFERLLTEAYRAHSHWVLHLFLGGHALRGFRNVGQVVRNYMVVGGDHCILLRGVAGVITDQNANIYSYKVVSVFLF